MSTISLTASRANIYFNSNRNAKSSLVRLKWLDPDSGAYIIATEEVQSISSCTISAGESWNGHTVPILIPIEISIASRTGIKQSSWSTSVTIEFTEYAVPEIEEIVPGELTGDFDYFIVGSFDEFPIY